MAAVRSGDPATLHAVLGRQRAHLLRLLHALADARDRRRDSCRVAAHHRAQLHTRADLGIVDAAEKTLTTGPAAVTGLASLGLTPPQTAAG
jgi:hypothetical protein